MRASKRDSLTDQRQQTSYSAGRCPCVQPNADGTVVQLGMCSKKWGILSCIGGGGELPRLVAMGVAWVDTCEAAVLKPGEGLLGPVRGLLLMQSTGVGSS